jgi:hypothetical protein
MLSKGRFLQRFQLAILGFVLAILAPTVSAGQTAVSFTRKPTVSRAGAKVTISFAVSGRTDAEVAIINAQSQVVRHLAAGVLGATSKPPSPLKTGLAQSLEWDGKDDYGQPVPVAGCSARVRLGMGVKVDKIVGGDPYAFWSMLSFRGDHAQWNMLGLEAKPDGNVYLLGNITSYGQGPALRQYDARGNYRRTVFPIPAGKPVADVKGWGINVGTNGTYALKASFGWATANPEWTLLSGRMTHSLATRLLASPGSDTLCIARADSKKGNRQITIGTDSTLRSFNPTPVFDGDPMSMKGPLFTALTPDRKSRYVSGLFAADEKRAKHTAPWHNGQVWKVEIATRKASLFFELEEKDLTPDRSGKTRANPYAMFHGLAVDSDGRVFICDRQNGRIAVVDKDGKLVRSIPVANPDTIAVNPKSKAIYVTTRVGNYHKRGKLVLLKFRDWTRDKVPATTVVLQQGIGAFISSSFMAAVEDKGEIMIWVVHVALPARVYKDTGAGLKLVKDFYKSGPQQRALDLQHMMVDQKTGDAYISDSQSYCFRVRDWKNPKFELCMQDPKPGKASAWAMGYMKTRLPAASIAIDSGNRFLYALNHYGKPVSRWKMDGKYFTPAPVGNSNALTLPLTCSWIFQGLGQRGMAAAPGGGLATVGVLVTARGMHTDYSGPLHFFKPDATKTPWKGLKISKFRGPRNNSGGVRFDLQGNLYAGLYDRKVNNVPQGFNKDKDIRETTGRIYKFAPTGTGKDGDWFPTEPAAPAKVYDVLYGPLAADSRTPRFGVDGYGRIYYPSGLLSKVSVIDNQGNRILAFGTYGNRDSMGGLKGDLVPTKDIPMAWPNSVDATDDYIYLTDTLNIRLMRLVKTFAATGTAGVK